MERIIALDEVKVEFAMLRTPDGEGEIELVKFHSPPTQTGDLHAPATLQASATSPSSSTTSTPSSTAFKLAAPSSSAS